jgi:hypothetical protein
MLGFDQVSLDLAENFYPEISNVFLFLFHRDIEASIIDSYDGIRSSCFKFADLYIIWNTVQFVEDKFKLHTSLCLRIQPIIKSPREPLH